MNMNALIKDIHENAINHGFWEKPMPLETALALIHSEWSEALEEYRAGRPYEWYACMAAGENIPCRTDCSDYREGHKCISFDIGKKPEGIAVELVDGVIRIFDLYGFLGMTMPENIDYISCISQKSAEELEKMPFPNFINELHNCTSSVMVKVTDDLIKAMKYLDKCIALVACYLNMKGIDMMEVLMRKHEYNKSRPYMHGKTC